MHNIKTTQTDFAVPGRIATRVYRLCRRRRHAFDADVTGQFIPTPIEVNTDERNRRCVIP
jgi:hypothetical protein